MTLRQPDMPYTDWGRFTTALYRHGRRFGVMNAELIGMQGFRAGDAIAESFNRKEAGPPQVRPSTGLACAQQTYYITQGIEPEPMPDFLGTTFAI